MLSYIYQSLFSRGLHGNTIFVFCENLVGVYLFIYLFGHIPKLFFRDADDFDSKTPSSNVEEVKKLVNVVL